MKKLVVLFVYLCLLLLGGGQYLNAGTHQDPFSTTHNLEKKHLVKFTNQDSGSSIIEDADLDLEEDGLNNSNLKDTDVNKFFYQKSNLLGKWYLTNSHLFIANYYYKRLKISVPFCGYSNPIYITQRVLRI